MTGEVDPSLIDALRHKPKTKLGSVHKERFQHEVEVIRGWDPEMLAPEQLSVATESYVKREQGIIDNRYEEPF